MFEYIVLGACSGSKVFRAFQHTIGCAEGPKDACVEYRSFLCIGVELSVSIDASVKSAVFAVNHVVKPEGQDVCLKHILHLLLH